MGWNFEFWLVLEWHTLDVLYIDCRQQHQPRDDVGHRPEQGVHFRGQCSRRVLRPLVPGPVALDAEAHGAHPATIRLLAGVGPLVPGNVALVADPPEKNGTPRSPGLDLGIPPLPVGGTLACDCIIARVLSVPHPRSPTFSIICFGHFEQAYRSSPAARRM